MIEGYTQPGIIIMPPIPKVSWNVVTEFLKENLKGPNFSTDLTINHFKIEEVHSILKSVTSQLNFLPNIKL